MVPGSAAGLLRAAFQRRVNLTSKVFVGDLLFGNIDASLDGRRRSFSRVDLRYADILGSSDYGSRSWKDHNTTVCSSISTVGKVESPPFAPERSF
jgi:hypothetical protein